MVKLYLTFLGFVEEEKKTTTTLKHLTLHFSLQNQPMTKDY